MTGRDKKMIAEAIKERMAIVEMPQASAADKAYLNGMLDMAKYFGYEYRVDSTGEPMLIRV